MLKDIYYTFLPHDGDWSIPENLSRNPSMVFEPITSTGSGQGWISSHRLGECRFRRCLSLVYSPVTRGWVVQFQGDSSTPWIHFPGSLGVKVDENDGLHFMWEGELATNYVAYAGPVYAPQTGDSAISQAMTIPVTMTAPTLSFLYQLGGASAAGGHRADGVDQRWHHQYGAFFHL